MRFLRRIFGGGRDMSPPTGTEQPPVGVTEFTVRPGETIALPDGAAIRMPTAAELDARHASALRAWQTELARLGGVTPKPVTRGTLASVMRARGWERVIKNGETLFLRDDDRGTARIQLRLSTRAARADAAPEQQLGLTCSLTPHDFRAVYTALAGPDVRPILVGMISVHRTGFVLTRADLESAVTEAEAKLAAADIALHLDQAAGWDPARPGASGLVHLTALVLRRDRARLDRYAALGTAAGFAPFITPEMLARAATLARDRQD